MQLRSVAPLLGRRLLHPGPHVRVDHEPPNRIRADTSPDLGPDASPDFSSHPVPDAGPDPRPDGTALGASDCRSQRGANGAV